MGGAFRILLVEDDPGHALLLERALARGGVRNELRRFETGEELLEFLDGDHDPARPDVVLLDLHLPGLDGIGILRRMRDDPRLAGLGVIVLSTTLDPAEERECHYLGCDGFLLKPLRTEEFIALLERLGMTPLVG